MCVNHQNRNVESSKSVWRLDLSQHFSNLAKKQDVSPSSESGNLVCFLHIGGVTEKWFSTKFIKITGVHLEILLIKMVGSKSNPVLEAKDFRLTLLNIELSTELQWCLDTCPSFIQRYITFTVAFYRAVNSLVINYRAKTILFTNIFRENRIYTFQLEFLLFKVLS